MYLLRTRRNREGGYTLVEAIIQLSVLMIFSQLFAITIGSIYKTENEVTNPIETEWALFIRELEKYLNNVEILTIQQDNTGIRLVQNGEEFDIELYQNLIRKQKNRLGHEQMLLHVKSISTKLEDQSLRFSVVFLNGIEKEHTFYVRFHKE